MRRTCVVYLCGQSHAARGKQSIVAYPCSHHAELLPVDKGDQVLDLLLQLRILQVLLSIWVRGLVAGVCVAERHLGGLTEVVICDERSS